MLAAFVLEWNVGPLCALVGEPIGPLLCLILWVVLVVETNWKRNRDRGWLLIGTLFGVSPFAVCIIAMS